MPALAIDLGTTRVKAAVLAPSGGLSRLAAAPAPAVGDGGAGAPAIRESDPVAYAAAADKVLAAVCARSAPSLLLGVASQRSSFLLWEREGGRPLTPLISWQDRRAAAWCAERASEEPALVRRTGLRLSPHYAGPKLAWLFEKDPRLRVRAATGEVLFGTLDTYLAWRWTGGREFFTDVTMAARTLLADPRTGTWDPELLEFCGVPAAVLPAIRPTRGWVCPGGEGFTLAARVADQAAGLLAVCGRHRDLALVNLGTGGFVLLPSGREPCARAGYLWGPVFGGRGGRALFASEGTINGAGQALDLHGGAPDGLPSRDPAPEAFCLPDTSGLGAPHWRPERSQTFSPAGQAQTTRGKRRLVLEGLVFRIREILEGLGGGRLPARILLSGGVSRAPILAPALAACLGRPVERLGEAETTLLGAARLAAGGDPAAALPAERVEPPVQGAWLAEKYAAWKAWARAALA